MAVLAADRWASNAELIAAVHELGYLRDGDHVLDPTFGKGTWWNVWRPEKLTGLRRSLDGTDFRDLPFLNETFDAVAFDPPYVCPGGRKTSTIQNMHNLYGMNEGGAADPDFKTPAELQAIINAGLTEMARLVRPARTKHDGGIILTKCANYIWSGDFFEGAELTRDHAKTIGLAVVDRFEFLTKPGPQPTVNRDGSARRQVHARRNLSTLWVFRKRR